MHPIHKHPPAVELTRSVSELPVITVIEPQIFLNNELALGENVAGREHQLGGTNTGSLVTARALSCSICRPMGVAENVSLLPGAVSK